MLSKLRDIHTCMASKPPSQAWGKLGVSPLVKDMIKRFPLSQWTDARLAPSN